MFDKKLEGENVYLLPTGNNVSRDNSKTSYEQVVKAKIIKVSRVNITFIIENRNNESVYRKSHYNESIIVDKHNNCGYHAFKSLDDIEDFKYKNYVISMLRKNVDNINKEQALKIGKIMGW